MTDKFDTFADLLRGALADRLVPADDMAGLFTDDVIFEFPFAPEGMPRRLDGRAALADHIARLGPILSLGQMVLRDVHRSGLCCINRVRDSSCESSVVAWMHEQTRTPDLQDQELAGL